MKERRNTIEELYEIFLNYSSSYKRIRIDMTHTASIMPLPISYFIPMNSPYHTSMNSKKKREKKIRWTMTTKDIHYRMYICAFLFDSTFIFFSSYALSF